MQKYEKYVYLSAGKSALSGAMLSARGVGVGGELGGNCGVRASISKPTPFIYPAFEKNKKKKKKKKTKKKKKNGPIHILDSLKYWPIHILPFDFLYPFTAGS